MPVCAFVIIIMLCLYNLLRIEAIWCFEHIRNNLVIKLNFSRMVWFWCFYVRFPMLSVLCIFACYCTIWGLEWTNAVRTYIYLETHRLCNKFKWGNYLDPNVFRSDLIPWVDVEHALGVVAVPQQFPLESHHLNYKYMF